MLCENCKEREATVHFTEIMNGRVQKHHLCKECAAQMEMMGYASNEVPFVKLLTGMLAAGQTQEQGENPLQYVRCPKCGMTYEGGKVRLCRVYRCIRSADWRPYEKASRQ